MGRHSLIMCVHVWAGTHHHMQANVNTDTECLRSFQLSMHTYIHTQLLKGGALTFLTHVVASTEAVSKVDWYKDRLIIWGSSTKVGLEWIIFLYSPMLGPKSGLRSNCLSSSCSLSVTDNFSKKQTQWHNLVWRYSIITNYSSKVLLHIHCVLNTHFPWQWSDSLLIR